MLGTGPEKQAPREGATSDQGLRRQPYRAAVSGRTSASNEPARAARATQPCLSLYVSGATSPF
jgi:hypothetical protein